MFDFDLANDITDYISGVNRLSEAKKDLKGTFRFAFIGTVLAVGLSVGIQYLILRVWGGA